MTTGGLRQVMLTERSRLGDESLDEGLDDRDRDDLGLVGGAPESSGSGKERVSFWIVCSSNIFLHHFYFGLNYFYQTTIMITVYTMMYNS